MKASWTIILALIVHFTEAQEWRQVISIKTDVPITAFDADPQGNLYVGTAAGNVIKYAPSLLSRELYSDLANFPVTSIAAWNRLRVFVFFQDDQQFAFLDRFTAQPKINQLESYTHDLIWQCSPGIDNSLWALSTAYHELRKYNLQTRELITALPLQQSLKEVTHIRAYQNLLLVSDKETGIFIFDQYANLQHKINQKGVHHFQIIDGQLLFYAKGQVHRVDLFQPYSHERLKAPEGAFSAVLDLVGNYAFISPDQIALYSPL
ncbi:hypothetical protein [Marinoscillum furvescens]|uniref:Two component regulator with propeller domain n=1 Tax=Marinoscillum furvescens DSM 4134 TaxID=1122208 RepID=A0A3D9L313_MARFU|nr:hypothetical protein [Marinoscillum furvescens]RED99529.1 hypothetical protein C7460_108149 [Marinoscillum furvescens DSM 4134]